MMNEEEDIDPYNPFPELVIVEFTDVLDLHSIPPKQVKAIVEDYLIAAREKGFRVVRIIHGKGIGVQKEIVRSVLTQTSFVKKFVDAPAEAGGWGATIAHIEID